MLLLYNSYPRTIVDNILWGLKGVYFVLWSQIFSFQSRYFPGGFEINGKQRIHKTWLSMENYLPGKPIPLKQVLRYPKTRAWGLCIHFVGNSASFAWGSAIVTFVCLLFTEHFFIRQNKLICREQGRLPDKKYKFFSDRVAFLVSDCSLLKTLLNINIFFWSC